MVYRLHRRRRDAQDQFFFAENCLAADAVKEVELLKVFVIQVFILVLNLLRILFLLIKDDLGFSNLLPFGCLLQSLHTVVCSHKSNKKPEWVVAHQLLLQELQDLHPHELVEILLPVLAFAAHVPSSFNFAGNLLLCPHTKQPDVGEPLVHGVRRQVGLLVAGLRQEALLYNSIVGLMTVAKLVHKEDKVMQLCVAVCDDRIVQQ